MTPEQFGTVLHFLLAGRGPDLDWAALRLGFVRVRVETETDELLRARVLGSIILWMDDLTFLEGRGSCPSPVSW